MACEICGKEAKKREGKLCSGSCRYKRNVLVWVLKYMKDHGMVDGAKNIYREVFSQNGKEEKSAETKVETKEKEYASEAQLKSFMERTHRTMEQAIKELKKQGVEVRWKDKSEEKPASIYEDGE